MKALRHFLRRSSMFLLAGALFLSAGPGLAGTPSERAARLAAQYGLEKPEGNGPFPAVMLVPECSGFAHRDWKNHYLRVTQQLKALGFAVIRVDYLAAGELSNCGFIMNPAELANDLVTASEYLRTQSFIKPDAINVLAWSYGGGVAFNALVKTEEREPVRIAAVVAYYPMLPVASPWNVDVPVLVMCSAEDTVAHCDHFERLLAEVPNRRSVKFVKYPEGFFGFDNPDLGPKVQHFRGYYGYKQTTATAAWSEVVKFLHR